MTSHFPLSPIKITLTVFRVELSNSIFVSARFLDKSSTATTRRSSASCYSDVRPGQDNARRLFLSENVEMVLKAFIGCFGFGGARIDRLRACAHSIASPRLLLGTHSNCLGYVSDSFASRWYDSNGDLVAYDKGGLSALSPSLMTFFTDASYMILLDIDIRVSGTVVHNPHRFSHPFSFPFCFPLCSGRHLH